MAHELTGATVLLKGAITMVVGTDEEKRSRVILSGRAPAWLSTAGAGDVLAGMLGALLAQQGDLLADEPAHLPEVAASAAYLHGLAAATASAWTPNHRHGCHRFDPPGLRRTDSLTAYMPNGCVPTPFRRWRRHAPNILPAVAALPGPPGRH